MKSKINFYSARLRDFMLARKEYAVIIAITVFYLINNLIWLSLSNFACGPDEYAHLIVKQKIFTFLFVSPDLLGLKEFLQGNLWPPFYHFVTAVLNLVLGTTYLACVMVNIPYLIILLFSVYFIGLKLYGKNIGIFAAALVSMYPMVFVYSRVYNPDFALTATVALGICLLIYSNYFRNIKISILFGFILGIGMLTKWTYILYLSGPLVYALIYQIRLRNEEKLYFKHRIFNIVISISLGLLICSFWYFLAFPVFSKRVLLFFWFFFHNHPVIDSSVSSRSLLAQSNFFDYPLFIINEGISFLFFIVFFAAAVAYFKKFRNKMFLILWFIAPYIILSLSSQKEGRFMLPLFPAIALVSAAGLQFIIGKLPRYFSKMDLYFIIILLGAVQFFDISYNRVRDNDAFSFRTPIGIIQVLWAPVSEHYDFALGQPVTKDWKIDKVAETVAGYFGRMPQESPFYVGVICAEQTTRKVFNYSQAMEYYILKNNFKLKFSVLSLITSQREDAVNFVNKVNELDCVVYVSGDNTWPEYPEIKETFNQLVSSIAEKFKGFEELFKVKHEEINKEILEKKFTEFLSTKDLKYFLLKRIKLPEGYFAFIYVKKTDKTDK